MRTIFRWLFRLALLLVVLGVLLGIGGMLLKDPIARSLAEKNLRDSTGMDAKIARFDVGILTPTVNVEGLKVYNRPEFGGGSFLELPELRLEYDPDLLRQGKLRLKTVRLHIAEVTIVKGKDGKTNIEAIEKEAKKKSGGEKKRTDTPGVDFDGIDTVYLTVGKIKVVDLTNPRQSQEINVGLKDEVGRNLKTEADVVSWLGTIVLKLYIQEMFKKPGESSLRSLMPTTPPKRR
jgi:ribosomal protein S25